ncbi:hypothetical protein B0H14DRAFT_2575177 [Mycena olivaceomarginata]|nr:hypothetical protein B0H14DRAFT_2575177 [Mycena olivaceomarginata]
MSDEGSPPPVTPSRKRTTRMRTSGRKPLPSATDRFLDLEAVESGESAGEENLDKYESDFIDDGGDDDRAPISWSRTPSPTPEMQSSKVMASKVAEPAKQEVGTQPPIAPMTTRSRAKNIPNTAGAPKVAAKTGPALNLNTDCSRADANTGVKAASVLPGTERGDTQRKLETVRKPTASVVVNMDSEEHESAGGNSTQSLSSSDSASFSVGRERSAPPDTPPSGALHAGAIPDKIVSKAAGKKPANRGAKRKRSGTDESEPSEPETAVVTSPSPRKPVTAPMLDTRDFGRGVLPKVPTAEFDRLKEASPAKKPKKEETTLHTVDIKRVQALPAVCEVMDVDLQDPMMHSIYALDLPKLKRGQVTTWSSNEGSGMFMLSQYPVINPKLSIATVWALLLFVRKGHYINPARIDPRVLEARSPVYARDGPRKRHEHSQSLLSVVHALFRWVLSVDARPAVCVSVVNSVQSSVQQISTVYGASNSATPLLKFITGVHLSQDFDRITEKLGSPDQKGIKSSSSLYRKQTYTAPTDSLNYDDNIPVYDDDLARILPLYTGEIPANSCTAVAYTISNFVKHYPGRD